MKLIASTLAAITFACAAVAIAEPRLRTQPQVAAPAQAPVQAQVPWQKHKNSEGDAPTTEFTAAEPKQMNCELMADTFEQGPPRVAGVTAPPACDDRPPQVNVVWGAQPPPSQGVIESVGTKYTMFSPEGAPARATTNPEAAGKQKQGDGAVVQAPTRIEQRTYRPAPFRTTPQATLPAEDDDDDD